MKTDFHVEFKIKFTAKSKLWAKVLIFQDRETMYRFYQGQLKITGQKGKNDFRAMWQPFKTIKIDKVSKETTENKVGNLLLDATFMGAGLIAHECGHGAFDYWRNWRGRTPINNMGREDEFLHVLGYLVAQFWTGYFKHEKEIKKLVS